MSHDDPRAEAAGIARSLRRMIERERAAGGGDLLAWGVAHDRARAETLERERVAALPTIALPSFATPAPATGGRPVPPPAAPVRAAVTPPPAAESAAPPARDPLPAFTEPLWPNALRGARDGFDAAARPALDEIAAAARACTQCALAPTRTNVVPGTGSAASGIVFLGEAPGETEDETGEPFVGRAGQLLTDMINAMETRKLLPGVPVSRDSVWICNVVKCRPPGNRNPAPPEIEACSPFVMRQLAALKPRVICCLGKFAAELLLGTRYGTIAAMRGNTYRWRGAKLIVTYHPAYCLRSPSAKRPVWDDLQRLAQEYLND